MSAPSGIGWSQARQADGDRWWPHRPARRRRPWRKTLWWRHQTCRADLQIPEITVGKGARAIDADDDHVVAFSLIELDQFIEGANFTGTQDGGHPAAGRQAGQLGQLLGPVDRKGR
jgi:hypothetical protein